MSCPQCKHDNAPSSKFCVECGTRLPTSCAQCGAELPLRAKFCPECGEPTGASKSPDRYTPKHLAEKILTSKSALEGERKQVTVLFADLKGSMELLADRDPEEARTLLNAVVERMMEAVHRYEGTVNNVMGDGIMAIFGAPLAHEDHAVRACYAALRMQDAVNRYSDEMLRSEGVPVMIRVGLNSGEVVVGSVGNDLKMDYTAVGQTTHLAARMEQMAKPGAILVTSEVLRLAEGYVQAKALGPFPVKGLPDPVEVYEITGGGSVRTRLEAAARRGFSRFVGRDAEMEQLRRSFEAASNGRGQVVAVVGEAGVGKSRLLWELTRSHRVEGDWLILEIGSTSYGKATAYLPIIDLLKGYFKVQDWNDHREVREKVTGKLLTLDTALENTLPAFLTLLDVPSANTQWEALDPPRRRQQTLEAIKRLLLQESQVQPLCLVFEDLHWIDSETQALLDNLVENLPTARLLLLVNYRPEYQHGWGHKTYYTQLRLDPLPPESADELLRVLLGNDPSLGPLKELLIERTVGNPFFLEESVRTLVETQVLVGEPGVYRLVQDLPSSQVPATVQAILAARIDRLPRDEKRLLQTAAVIGIEVPLPLLQAISEVPEELLYRGMTRLQAAEFLYETDLFPERIYTFKHALTQNVAYQSLLTSTRQQYHRRIARVLDERFTDAAKTQPELLAHHYTEGGCREQAIFYWQLAGQRAREGSAHGEAIVHLTKGLAILALLPESPERDGRELMFQVSLGNSLSATRGWAAPEVEDVYARAHELCEKTADAAQLFPVLWGSSQVYIVRADLRKHRDIGERFLSLAQSQQDPVSLTAAHWVMGVSLFHAGNFAVARKHTGKAYTMYDPEQHGSQVALFGVDLGVFALSYMAHTLWCLGYPEQALHKSHDAIALARKLSHPFSLTVAMAYAATLHQFRRQTRAALERADATVALCKEHGFAYYLAWGTIIQGWVGVESGEVEDGIAEIQEGLSALQATGGGLRLPYYRALLAATFGMKGQVDEGLRALDAAFIDVGQTEERWLEAELHRLRGDLLLRKSPDSQTEAEPCFRRALDIARTQQAKFWELRATTSLARLWQSKDMRQDAYDLLAPAYEWFTEGFDTADLKEAKVLLDELR